MSSRPVKEAQRRLNPKVWEKSHFMVREGVVLGPYLSSCKGLKVDKAKIEVIQKASSPSYHFRFEELFSGMSASTRHSYKTFAKVSKPLTTVSLQRTKTSSSTKKEKRAFVIDKLRPRGCLKNTWSRVKNEYQNSQNL